MESDTLQVVSAVLFGAALVHTSFTKFFEMLAHRHPRHGGLFHLLGEVEVVFGFRALVLIIAMALIVGGGAAVDYAESRQFTEPLFVLVIMVVAASRPVLDTVRRSILKIAQWLARQIGAHARLIWACVGSGAGVVHHRTRCHDAGGPFAARDTMLVDSSSGPLSDGCAKRGDIVVTRPVRSRLSSMTSGRTHDR